MSRQYLTAVGLTSIVRSQGHIHKVYEKKIKCFTKNSTFALYMKYIWYILHTQRQRQNKKTPKKQLQIQVYLVFYKEATFNLLLFGSRQIG